LLFSWSRFHAMSVKETGAFNRRHDFGQGGHIAARIFRDPWIGRTRPVRPADGVNKSDSILVEQMRDFPEVRIVMRGRTTPKNAPVDKLVP
jgi:hypothetical protein